MGGDTTISQPAAPTAQSTQETSKEAIQAQIDAIPDILMAQQQYGPEFNEEQIKAFKEFGPQYAQIAQEIQQKYTPELVGAQKTLADFLNTTDEQEYNQLMPGVRQDIRAGQSARGIGDISPLGSIDESVQLVRLKQSLKDRRLNIALSTAGRVPITSAPMSSGVGQLVQNVNPDSIFNYQAGLNNFNASVYGTQAGMYNNSIANQSNVMGTILGTVGGAAAGGFGTSIGGSMATAAATMI